MKTRAAVAFLAFATALVCAAPAFAQAQTGTVTGQVTEQGTARPLPGVLVQVVGTRLAQTTNENGRFMFMNVPTGRHTVTAEFLGYAEGRAADIEVTAGETTTANIVLEQTALSLEEVVVTGVSEATTGRMAPFTVGRVSKENIATVPTTNSAVAAIQGKVAGASIVRGSGQPGSGVSVLLRTPTSIQGGNSPMFVVDGVILHSGIGGTTVDLESLDIESIEVVKGAAAASLYGSRAASGVVAITTSRGRNLALDQTRITTRTEFGTSQAPKSLDLVTAHPYLQNSQGEWIDTDGNVVPRTLRVVGPTNMVDQEFRTPLYDNVSEFFRPAQFMQNSVNLSHRAESTNFLASATRYDERGTLESNEGFTRDNFRVNLDHRIRSDFSLGVSAQHSRYKQDLLYGGTSGTFWDLLMYPRDVNLGRRDESGEFLQLPDSTYLVENPIWYENSREFDEQRTRTLASVDARYNPFSFLTFIGNIAYDRSDERQHAYTPKGTSISLTSETESDGYLSKRTRIGDVLNASLQGNLQYYFGPLSTRTVVRALIEQQREDYVRADGSDFFVSDVPRLNTAATRSVQSSFEEVRSTGYFVEETLDYGGKYVLTALGRIDGSSLFGENERWHPYYRLGGSWLLSEEPWWGFDPLTLFKLRYSIGTAGGRPGFYAQYETWSVGNTGTVAKNTLGNKDLKPEHTTEQEMGIDMIFNDRYSLQLTYATQVTKDQIIQIPLPAMFGYVSQYANTGVQSGHTYEATLEAQIINRPGFNWSTTLVADRSRSRIDEWNRSCFFSGTFALRQYCQGNAISDMFGERFLQSHSEIAARHPDEADQFQVNDDGYVVWVGDGADWRQGLAQNLWGTSGVVDGEQYAWGQPILDRDETGFNVVQKIGSSIPDVSLGWLNNVFWRGFQFHSQLHAQIGGEVYNNTKQRLYQHERHGDYDQRSKDPETRKTIDYYQTLYNRNNNTSHFVEDGSYLKLRALSVQYRFNQDQLNRVGIGGVMRNLSLGVNARNLFTITNYSGFDPEVGSVVHRYDSFDYPNARQLTLTAEITF